MVPFSETEQKPDLKYDCHSTLVRVFLISVMKTIWRHSIQWNDSIWEPSLSFSPSPPPLSMLTLLSPLLFFPHSSSLSASPYIYAHHTGSHIVTKNWLFHVLVAFAFVLCKTCLPTSKFVNRKAVSVLASKLIHQCIVLSYIFMMTWYSAGECDQMTSRRNEGQYSSRGHTLTPTEHWQ